MKIQIDITDFYLDEDDNIEQGLKDYVKKDVLAQISKSIKEKVDSQVLMEVKDIVEKNLYKEISAAIKETVATCKMQSRKDRSVEITMEEYVRECFISNNSYNKFDDTIKNINILFIVTF